MGCKAMTTMFLLHGLAVSMGAGSVLPIQEEARGLDSLGGGHLLRRVDSLGGNRLLRRLDSLGGSALLRNLDSLGGGQLLLRQLDTLGGNHLPIYRRPTDTKMPTTSQNLMLTSPNHSVLIDDTPR